jgi:hypothetical protein
MWTTAFECGRREKTISGSRTRTSAHKNWKKRIYCKSGLLGTVCEAKETVEEWRGPVKVFWGVDGIGGRGGFSEFRTSS